jgi:hypothetical protein
MRDRSLKRSLLPGLPGIHVKNDSKGMVRHLESGRDDQDGAEYERM